MSFEDLLKQANQGDAEAQYIIGEHYFDTFQDYTRAMKYYQLSANQNHPEALNCIGWYYYNGNSVAQNYETTFKYFSSSAEQKCATGFSNVAWCYETGCGVKKDLKIALKYHHLCGRQDNINDCELLILKQFDETLNETDYAYAYPLYVKHNYKGLDKLKILLNAEYVKAMYFMPPVLSDIIISYLL